MRTKIGSSKAPTLKHANAAFAQRLARRQYISRIALALAFVAMVFGTSWLVWILWETLRLGIGALNLSTLSQMTPPPNEEGGLANAIFGSLVMVVLATCVGTPLGVMTGIYLAEYGGKSTLAQTTRFVNDILLSAPSIVAGLFIYALVVRTSKTFSAIAGVLALAVLVIPIVVRTTEDMLRLVPANQREAAYALGAPKWMVIVRVALRAARTGVITAVLLAIARISGETAPLLFTALNNQFWSTNLGAPIANLPVTIFKFAMSPYENWQKLAWGGVLVVTGSVLILNIIARLLARRSN
jgi:phosphate transport system permease protein